VHRVRGPRIHPVTADVNVGALGEAAAPHGVQECREIAQREVREQDGWATLDQAARDRSEGRLRALRCVCALQVFTSGAYDGAPFRRSRQLLAKALLVALSAAHRSRQWHPLEWSRADRTDDKKIRYRAGTDESQVACFDESMSPPTVRQIHALAAALCERTGDSAISAEVAPELK
jgi:hypothetical protein